MHIPGQEQVQKEEQRLVSVNASILEGFEWCLENQFCFLAPWIEGFTIMNCS